MFFSETTPGEIHPGGKHEKFTAQIPVDATSFAVSIIDKVYEQRFKRQRNE